jgi:hypothetical protein
MGDDTIAILTEQKRRSPFGRWGAPAGVLVRIALAQGSAETPTTRAPRRASETRSDLPFEQVVA